MTKTVKVWAAVVATLLAVVIALLIALLVQGAAAERERQNDACNAQYPDDVYSNSLCKSRID